MSSYREMTVWQESMQLTTELYHATRGFPSDEHFELRKQLRRSAVSIASNIAEGKGKLTRREFRTYVGNARGSCLELTTQIEIAHNVGFIGSEEFLRLRTRADSIGKMLNGLLAYLSS